jgi:hypothetical protein
VMRARLGGGRESRDQIATAILAGRDAQHLSSLIEPVVAPDLDVGPPTAEDLQRLATQRAARDY